ncbi:MAG: hypothetical protein NTV86_20040 [Planctomycetota bacterium]|nr:hypothetical protein [Planctomycetota bacterium]
MNEVRMEWTDGPGRAAEIWVDGTLLHVCDNVSTPDRRCPAGVLENVLLTYVTDGEASWADSIRDNVTGRKRLEPIRGWSYLGSGRIVSVMPVVIDFGLLTMPDPRWSTDNSLIGRDVQVVIDRLELRPAYAADWPRG